jgi:hypothetical protein
MDLGALELPGACRSDLRLFVRGDCDQNRSLDLSDGVGTFAFLFLGGSSPSCLDACDSNDDGQVNLTDGIYTLGFLFLGGPAPPAPFPAAGEDPSADLLGVCR